MSTPFLCMLNTPEIILILALALILFGAKKLPELARGLGHGIREFKKASRDVTNELQNAMDAEPPPPPPPPAPALAPAEGVVSQSPDTTPPVSSVSTDEPEPPAPGTTKPA